MTHYNTSYQNPYNYMTRTPEQTQRLIDKAMGKGVKYSPDDHINGVVRHTKVIDEDSFPLGDGEEIRDNILGFYNSDGVWMPYPNSAELTKNAKHIIVKN